MGLKGGYVVFLLLIFFCVRTFWLTPACKFFLCINPTDIWQYCTSAVPHTVSCLVWRLIISSTPYGILKPAQRSTEQRENIIECHTAAFIFCSLRKGLSPIGSGNVLNLCRAGTDKRNWLHFQVRSRRSRALCPVIIQIRAEPKGWWETCFLSSSV